jgi:hypothetical protein
MLEVVDYYFICYTHFMFNLKKEQPIPLLEESFHHDGRGPELQKVIYHNKGMFPKGFEYFNPEDEHIDVNLKHVELLGVEAISMAGEEVHPAPYYCKGSKAAIFRIENSLWKKVFQQIHLQNCNHFQIMFYDEIFDVICKDIKAGKGKLSP